MNKTPELSLEELAYDAARIISKSHSSYLSLFLSNSSLERMDILRHSFEIAMRKLSPAVSIEAASNGRINYNQMLSDKQANPNLLFVIYEIGQLNHNRHEIISRSYHLDIEASMKIIAH